MRPALSHHHVLHYQRICAVQDTLRLHVVARPGAAVIYHEEKRGIGRLRELDEDSCIGTFDHFSGHGDHRIIITLDVVEDVPHIRVSLVVLQSAVGHEQQQNSYKQQATTS